MPERGQARHERPAPEPAVAEAFHGWLLFGRDNWVRVCSAPTAHDCTWKVIELWGLPQYQAARGNKVTRGDAHPADPFAPPPFPPVPVRHVFTGGPNERN